MEWWSGGVVEWWSGGVMEPGRLTYQRAGSDGITITFVIDKSWWPAQFQTHTAWVTSRTPTSAF